jgi:hypothetical protein
MSVSVALAEAARRTEERLPKVAWPGLKAVELDARAMMVSRGGAQLEEHRGVDVFQAAESKAPWLVMGEPGSGKSTLLAGIVRSAFAEGRWAFFLPMASYDPSGSLDQQLASDPCAVESENKSIVRGGAAFIIDALDEARLEDMDLLFEKVLSWAEPVVEAGNVVVLSCRTGEVPAWVHARVAEARLVPLDEDEVNRVFESVRASTGRPELEANPLDGLDTELRELCRNPLLLMMTVYLYQSEGLEALQQLNSRANVYRYFFDQLSRWESRKRAPLARERLLSPAVREAIYAHIGLRMHEAGRVYIRAADMERWISEALNLDQVRQYIPLSALTTADAFEVIALSPPMTARGRGVLGDLEYGFVHQTFGDVFAAMAIVSTSDPVTEAEALFRSEGRRHWDVVIPMAGLLDSPEALIHRITRVSFEERRQDLLLLAARCLRDRWDVDRSEADDLCLRILEAFKYWDAFDYALIRALKDLRTSPRFPRRLRRDSMRFVSKYANFVPTELGNLTLEDLIRYLGSSDLETSCNAAFTLGQREYGSEGDQLRVIDALVERSRDASGQLHEQLTSALKDLAHPASRSHLEMLCRSRAVPVRSKAFALNGLGRIGDPRSIDVVVEYLLDHESQYRDSASWSLQALALKTRAVKSPRFAEIKRVYARALQAETSNIEGVFAKGNIMYSLGVLGAKEFLDDIVTCVETAEDPYVVEDGVNAIGLLGGATEIPLLEKYVTNDDPVVRMKAAEALLRLDPQGEIDIVRRLLLDKSAMVRDAISIRLAEYLEESSSADPGIAVTTDSIHNAFANPTMDRDRVLLKLGEEEAKLVRDMAETLLEQREIATRPRIEDRSGTNYVTLSQEAFNVLRDRLGALAS